MSSEGCEGGRCDQLTMKLAVVVLAPPGVVTVIGPLALTESPGALPN